LGAKTVLGAKLVASAATIASEEEAELRGALEHEGGEDDDRGLGPEGRGTEQAGAGMLGQEGGAGGREGDLENGQGAQLGSVKKIKGAERGGAHHESSVSAACT
jgi:hypothetical protein